MIELIRPEQSALADEVEEQLKDLVLAHRVVRAEDDAVDQPVITEGEHEYREPEEIQAFLDELRGEVMTGRQLQSDSCVLNPEDPRHCL